MKNLESISKHQRNNIDKKRNLLALIRENLGSYSNKHISINECVSNTGALTTDLMFYHIGDKKVSKNAQNTIFIVTVNYYAMLYMKMFTGNFTVDKNHTYKQVASLVKNVLTKTSDNGTLKTDDLDDAINTSREFSKQMVDIFYRAGTDGCQKYLTASIYSILLPENGYEAVNREKIESTIRTLDAERFFNGL